jgi:guanine deaminase
MQNIILRIPEPQLILPSQRTAAKSPGRLVPEFADARVAYRLRRYTVHETRMDNSYMARAIHLAIDNVRSGRGGPFGAVIVKDGNIVAEGANQVTFSKDPTAHAEVLAIRAACQKLDVFDLEGCEIFTSCEPCPMCLGAIYWARLSRIYFASAADDAAKAGFDDSLIYREIAQPHAQRKVPMIQTMRDQSLAAFRAWQEKPDKIDY